MKKIISIRWDGTQYRVDRPNWEGDEVVPLADVVALIEAVQENRSATLAFANDGSPDLWAAYEDSERKLEKVIVGLADGL